MMSGPRVAGFRQGWALPLGSFSKAHYFTRYEVKSGLAGRLFEPGDFPKCQLCVRAIKFHGVPA